MTPDELLLFREISGQQHIRRRIARGWSFTNWRSLRVSSGMKMGDPGADGAQESEWLYELLVDVQLEAFYDKSKFAMRMEIQEFQKLSRWKVTKFLNLAHHLPDDRCIPLRPH